MAARTGQGNTPPHIVRVEDDLWAEAGEAAALVGTTRSEAMREGLRELVRVASMLTPSARPDAGSTPENG